MQNPGRLRRCSDGRVNVLPLKYHEAYSLYKQMKASHWEPDVIDMSRDVHQWNTGVLSKKEQWIIEMGIGYFSAAEGIVGDSVLHVIEDKLTAAELKHAVLRHIAEESVHMDSLLHIVSSLNVDLDETYFDGSIQPIERIPADLKRLYKTAFEIEPTWILRAAAERQKWIDQAQSTNLWLAEADARTASFVYREA